MSRILENLRINRIVAHDVFRRGPGQQVQTPNYSSTLHALRGAGLTELQVRITEAVGHRSYCVEVEVEDDAANKTPDCCARLIGADEATFLTLSKQIADNLNAAQAHPSIGDSVLVVADGTRGVHNKPVVVLIKAEMQAGFSIEDTDGTRQLQFLEDLFLTKDQKFYKVGVFFAEPLAEGETEWEAGSLDALVYDQNLSRGHEIARYFFRDFMGCDLAGTAKRMTKEFYEAVINYVDHSNMSAVEKVDLTDALHVYLKSASGMISAREFEVQHVPENVRGEFDAAMASANVQEGMFRKDTALVDSKLKKRVIYFENGIQVSIPSGDDEDRYEVRTNGNEQETVLAIHSGIKKQK